MTPKAFANWIDRIYATESDELDCQQLQAALPAFVEAEVEGKRIDPVVTHRVKAHLHQCPDCPEVYEGLKHVLETVPDEAEEAYDEVVPSGTAVAIN